MPAEATIFPMRLARTSKSKDQRGLRWQGVISTTNVDSLNERLDVSIMDELVANFNLMREGIYPATAKSLVQQGWSGPILDPAHFSLFVPLEERDSVAVGTVEAVYRDGTILKAWGYIDPETEIGWGATRQILSGADTQTSICFYADPDLATDENGVRVYKGGSGGAYIDHIALTAVPVLRDTTVEIVQRSESALSGIETDVVAVLGADAAKLVLARRKSRRNGGLPKSEAATGDSTMPEDAIASLGDVVAALGSNAQAATQPPQPPVVQAALVEAAVSAPAETPAPVEAAPVPVAEAPAPPTLNGLDVTALIAAFREAGLVVQPVASTVDAAAIAPPAPAPVVVAASQAATPALTEAQVIEIVERTQTATIKSMLALLEGVGGVGFTRRSFATPPLTAGVPQPAATPTLSDVLNALTERRTLLTGIGGQ